VPRGTCKKLPRVDPRTTIRLRPGPLHVRRHGLELAQPVGPQASWPWIGVVEHVRPRHVGARAASTASTSRRLKTWSGGWPPPGPLGNGPTLTMEAGAGPGRANRRPRWRSRVSSRSSGSAARPERTSPKAAIAGQRDRDFNGYPVQPGPGVRAECSQAAPDRVPSTLVS
jgi:hypothetical protein